MKKKKNKVSPKKYILEIIKLYPQILSGEYEERLQKNLLIIKNYIKKIKHESRK